MLRLQSIAILLNLLSLSQSTDYMDLKECWGNVFARVQTKLLFGFYERHFNRGELDKLLDHYASRSALFLLNGTKVVGQEAISMSLTEMMRTNSTLKIDENFNITLKHGFHEFYVFGKEVRSSLTLIESLYFKRRIIRVQEGYWRDADFLIWTEHLSHKRIEEIPVHDIN